MLGGVVNVEPVKPFETKRLKGYHHAYFFLIPHTASYCFIFVLWVSSIYSVSANILQISWAIDAIGPDFALNQYSLKLEDSGV